MTSETESPSIRRSKGAIPVLWWASIGGVILILQIVVWTRWLLHAVPTQPGDTPQPQWMTIVQLVTQIVMPLLLVVTCYLYLIKPKIKTGKFSREGLLWISWLLLYFWDPFLNFFQNFAVYNANMVNLGSWTSGVFPGWSAPNSNFMAEPLLMLPAVYAAVLLPACLKSCALMERLRQRGLSAPANVAVMWVFMTVVSFILEGLIFMPLGFYAIPGADPAWSINAGEYYQFPVYHAAFFGAWCAAATALCFFTDSNDHTVVERGVERLRVGDRAKTFARFLALFAATVAFNALYFVPIQFFAIKSGPWPASIVEKSYFRTGMCGPGNDFACPGPEVPIPRGDSRHVTPDGRLSP